MIDIKRKVEESEFEYKLRLVLSKLNKELVLDWEELVELLDLDCSSHHLRKISYGLKEAHEYYQNKIEELAVGGSIDSDSILGEIEEKKIELQIERVKYQDQRREFQKLLREYARATNVQNMITEAVKELAEHKPLVVKPKDNHKNNPDREGALLLSDWHVGLFAENHWNDFNLREFYRRIGRLTEKTIEYGKLNEIKTLNIFLLGDLVNGLIHVTTRINNTENVVEQTKIVAETISEMIVILAREFENIQIFNVRGNHDRITPNKKDEIAKESFSDFIPWYLEARLDHIENIEILNNKYDDEIIVTEICGYKIGAVHGHRDKVGNVVQDLTLMTREFLDYVFMGHIHHNFSTEVHKVEVIVNPSLSGVDDFAKEIRVTSKPAQKFLIFDKEESLMNTYSIRLDK